MIDNVKLTNKINKLNYIVKKNIRILTFSTNK